MKVTILSDNIPQRDSRGGTLPFSSEWGFSAYIEYADKKILLDTGASSLFLRTAKRCGINIGEVDFAVLSHAHYDHADGLDAFFDSNKTAKCYISADTAENCYSKKLFFKKYIGIPRGILERRRERFVKIGEKTEISNGVYILPHTTADLDKLGKRNSMYRKIEGRYVYDDYSHEQSLVFDTDSGLVVFNSCSHAGADNIVNEVSKAFDSKPIAALVGGFHLYNKTEREVRILAENLGKTGVRVCTGHCTGDTAYRILKDELRDSTYRFETGLEITF